VRFFEKDEQQVHFYPSQWWSEYPTTVIIWILEYYWIPDTYIQNLDFYYFGFGMAY
jgi:hypothetical protein